VSVWRRFLPGLVAWLLHVALLAGLATPLPAGARVLLAFVALVMAPGLAFVAAGLVPPGGAWLAAGWALGFGVAWNALLIVASTVLHRPFTIWVVGAAGTTPLLWLALSPWILRRPVGAAVSRPVWSRGTLAALLLAAGLGAWHAGRYGAPLGYVTDSPDHIGTVRRMLATGDPFPTDAFFKDAGRAGEDPRKGLWHPQVALTSALSATDPVVTWRWLPVALVPLFVLNMAGLGLLTAGRRGAVLAAWALLVTYGGSFANQYLREAVFSTKLGDQLMIATAVALLADLERRERITRRAAVLLALAAVTVHVWTAIALTFAFTGFALGLVVLERGIGPRVRRLVTTALVMALVSAPWLAWRVWRQYAPVNPIHTAPQGMLAIAGRVSVMNLGVLWDWLGPWWVLVPFALPALWRAGRQRVAALYLATTPIVVGLLLFFPPLVTLLRPRLGYLLLRTVWMIPLAAILAWLTLALWDRARHGPARVLAGAGLLVVTLVSLPGLVAMAGALFHAPERIAAERDRSPLRWVDALRWMESGLPAGRVVLTDPITAYSIPMFTGHYVTLLLDQHSSPDDPHAVDRIVDARNALDPYGSWDTTRAVVRRYHADVIALNDRFVEPPVLVYWAPEHDWFVAARARLDAAPAAFERVYDREGFVVYRIHPAGLDTLSTASRPRPFVTSLGANPGPEGGMTGIRPMGEHLPVLVDVGLAPRVAAPGDTVRGRLDWRAEGALPRGSYLVSVRFDRALPGGFVPPRPVGKPVRKLIEKIDRERYRFRADHLPVGGDYGVDLWRPDEVVADSFAVAVPGDAAPGEWRVRVRFIAQAPYPNYRLSDYFFDDDYYSGAVVADLRITPRTGVHGAGDPSPASEGGH
jgi:hypothetical protein